MQTWFGMGPRLVNGNKKWRSDVDCCYVYCEKLQGKWNKNMPHVLNAVCTVYTPKFHVWGCGSNDMAVLNQVCFQTLFVVRHVNAIPNRILF